jgi:hypothetical protein
VDWQAVLTSVITSGIVSAVAGPYVAAYFERKKQNAQLLLERLEKAITSMRAEYDGFSAAVNEYCKTPFLPAVPELTLAANPLDFQVAILMCADHLDSTAEKYVVIRTQITSKIATAVVSEEERTAFNEQIAEDLVRLKDLHDIIVRELLSDCRRLIGVKKFRREAVRRERLEKRGQS